MATLAEFIENNMEIFKTFIQAGKLAYSMMNEYKIHTFYKSLRNMPSRMDRYQFTADSNGVSCNTVRKAVREMEKKV